MNRVERFVDGLSPRLSVRLRLFKKRLLGEPGLLLLPWLVRAGDVVVDIGANRGVYAHRLAQLVGRRGHVHVFEPFPANVKILESIRGRRANITVHPLALSDHAGLAALHVPLFEGQPIDALASLRPLHEPYVTTTVRLERLDAILASDGPPISFVKCDVEGHELAVLRGSETILRATRPALLVEIEQRHQSADIRETFAYLGTLGYVGYFLQGRRVRPLEEFDLQRHQLAFLGPGFVPYEMPRGYVSDFLFLGPGRQPPQLADR